MPAVSSAFDAGPAGETGADESEMVDFVVEKLHLNWYVLRIPQN